MYHVDAFDVRGIVRVIEWTIIRFFLGQKGRGEKALFELFYIERVDILSGVADVPRGGFYGNRNTQVRCFFNV
jgi:hypothetical protein